MKHEFDDDIYETYNTNHHDTTNNGNKDGKHTAENALTETTHTSNIYNKEAPDSAGKMNEANELSENTTRNSGTLHATKVS